MIAVAGLARLKAGLHEGPAIRARARVVFVGIGAAFRTRN